MVGSPINNQLALIRRELIEHRAIYVAPVVIAVFSILSTLMGFVFADNVDIEGAQEHIDMALLAASNIDENQRGAILSSLLLGVSGMFGFAMMFIMVFYALDALYAERKNKSILFWRSMPVTDAETVISKLLVTLLVIPVVTFGLAAVVEIVVLIISSIWVSMRGASAWNLIWNAAPLFDTWAVTLTMFVTSALWFAPFFGWFLLVSGFTKRSPFLMGIVPILLLPMLGSLILKTNLFWEILASRGPQANPIFPTLDSIRFIDEDALIGAVSEGMTMMSLLDFGRFFASIDMWLGLIVCGLFAGGAVYVRRYRDES